VAVLDAVYERRPPFSPEAVVSEFVELLKTYRATEVVGDRYGGEWPREQFRKLGIEYRVAEKPKSKLVRQTFRLSASEGPADRAFRIRRVRTEPPGLDRCGDVAPE
jgi:hypothetical protein